MGGNLFSSLQRHPLYISTTTALPHIIFDLQQFLSISIHFVPPSFLKINCINTLYLIFRYRWDLGFLRSTISFLPLLQFRYRWDLGFLYLNSSSHTRLYLFFALCSIN
ncbi:hypothetical protein Hanom_Chr12g01067681 [Helianthus anomalus]